MDWYGNFSSFYNNVFTTFEIKSWPFYFEDDFKLRNSLFGAVKLTKNDDPAKYSYSG